LGINPAMVAEKLAELFSQQIYIDGFVHCDPHAGNIFVRRHLNSFQIVLLDNGLYREYGQEFRLDYCQLWLALLNGDEKAIKYYSLKIGSTASYQLFASMLTTRSWNHIDATKMNSRYSHSELNELRDNAQNYASEITDILQNVPSELLLLFKTNDLLRCVNYDLGTSVNPFFINMKYCQKAITQYRREKNPSLLVFIQTWKDELLLSMRLKFYGFLLNLSFLVR